MYATLSSNNIIVLCLHEYLESWLLNLCIHTLFYKFYSSKNNKKYIQRHLIKHLDHL